jgi:putative oxidoreductase
MKIVALVARILLALLFLVSGLDKLFHFFPAQPLPPGAAGQFVGSLTTTKYLMFVGLCETVGGILLIVNRFVPLALTILGPVIVNILLTGFLMDHRGIVPSLVVTGLWLLVFWRVRSAFAGIFKARVEG